MGWSRLKKSINPRPPHERKKFNPNQVLQRHTTALGGVVMDQPSLWYDSWEDALSAAVEFIGGPKAVAHELWPSKNPVEAGRRLSRCLKGDRDEKLALHEIKYILKRGREAGCHLGTAYLLRDIGYADPVPVTPEDQRDEAMRQFSSAVKTVQDLAGRLEKLGVKVS